MGNQVWRFGGLAFDRQIISANTFTLAYIHAAIPYQTAKLNSANIIHSGDLGPNRHIYFLSIFPSTSIYMYMVITILKDMHVVCAPVDMAPPTVCSEMDPKIFTARP